MNETRELTPFVLAICAVAAIGGFLFGFDSGVINGTVESLSASFGSSAAGTGFSVASVLLGCAVGALVAGRLADAWGRKPCMLITAVFFAVSAWGSGNASSVAEFVVYRLVGGLGVGAASVIAPTYISEVAPARIRGSLASLQQLAIVVGLFAAFLSNYAIAQAAGGAAGAFWLGFAGWRWMFWVELAPSIAFFLGALAIPESPRHLVRKGRLDEARRVFRRVQPGVDSERAAEETVQAVQASLGQRNEPRYADLLGVRLGLRPIVWVGIILSALQQLVGINIVFYYGATLWQAAGFAESEALLVNVITGLTNILSTFLAIALVDRVGRRPLLLAGSVGMAVTLAGLSVIFGTADLNTQGELQLTGAMGMSALVLANLYVVSFATSWGPVVWVLLGEMFPNRIRGTALAVAASAQWVANFAITLTFPILVASVGLMGAYGVYATFALLSLLFVARYISETKQRTLEEMSAQELLASAVEAPRPDSGPGAPRRTTG
jgi:SP family sugar:H+ symporter-like MFS transporter